MNEENNTISITTEQKLVIENIGLKESNTQLQLEVLKSQKKELINNIVESAGKKLSDIEQINLDSGLITFKKN